MSCRKAKDWIREKLDGTLDPQGEARLEQHLDECPKCRQELATLTATVEWLEDLEPVCAPEGFDEQVLRRVREERRRAEERTCWKDLWWIAAQRWVRPAAATAGLLGAAALMGPELVRASSSFVSNRLAEPLARGTVRLVELANDPKGIETISDQAKSVSSPISLVGRSLYGGLLDMVVPVALWCAIGIAGIGFVWWVSRYSLQRRTRDASLAS
ncbi:MAG: zf-HC2 domain-containing protein [Candidatus Eisenbacteria sp.]|nr:zf-HC2 domain-containing protein [Candidatus Eisenbacteria bacterium]